MLLPLIFLPLTLSIPYFTPIQILRPTEDHLGLVPTEHLSALLSAPSPFTLVSVVGPYHSGKSFLLNALAGRTDVFKVGPSTSPETKGLYVARTDRKTEDGSEIWLLDSEGFFGPLVPEAYDAKVFTLAALLADKLVYNTVKVIDQNAVDRLEILLRRTNLFSTKASTHSAPSTTSTHSTVSPAGIDKTDLHGGTEGKRFELPELCWVVEDFVQGKSSSSDSSSISSSSESSSISSSSDASTESKKWLEQYLTPDSYIKRNIPTISVHTLFLPATLKSQLTDLSALPWDKLTPEFRVEVARLRLALFSKARKVFSPEVFVQTTHFLAEALNQGLFPELPSLWSHWQSQVHAASVKDAGKLFDQLCTKELDVYPPLTQNGFAEKLRFVEERAVQFFFALVGDKDQKVPRSLTDMIHTRAVASGRLHAENVDKYVLTSARAAIHEFKINVNKLVLPTEPEGLVQALGKAKEEVVAGVERVASELGGSTTGVTELSNSLATVISHTVEDNNKKIALVLQTATQAASGVVDAGLSGLGERLLGTQEMRAFELELKEKAMNKFEAETEQWKPWIRAVAMFHSTAQSVKAETQAKLTRFEAQHAVKVSDVFRKLSDRVLAEYRESRKDLELRSLPADELNLKERHHAIEAAINERFTDLAGNLADTESFRLTKTRLFETVKVDMLKLLRKNVELWKVHSDEATQCAVAMNVEHRKTQCWNGWMCLFALWPPTHRAVTKTNLNACFDKLQGSIPASMRDSVFESFYEKEMGREVTDVQRNLWITLLAILAPVVWWTLLKINRQ